MIGPILLTNILGVVAGAFLMMAYKAGPGSPNCFGGLLFGGIIEGLLLAFVIIETWGEPTAISEPETETAGPADEAG